MALTGNIADWSLADLLQIIAAERKSGTLTLRRGTEEVRLDFGNGLLTNARERHASPPSGGSRPRRAGGAETGDTRGGFLAFLVASGRIRPDQARAAILLARETGGDTTSAVQEAKLLVGPAFEEAMTAYVRDLFTRVLTWESADYSFAADKERGKAGHGDRALQGAVALNTDGLLLEGMRRIDEQPRIEQVVRPDTVFVRTEHGTVPPDLGDREAILLALIDGLSAVRALAPAAQLSEYEAAEGFFNLHQAGLISAREGATVRHAAAAPALALPDRARASVLQVAALALALAISLGFRLAVHGAILPRTAALGPAPLTAHDAQVLAAAHALHEAHTGRRAEGAPELIKAGLLPGGIGRWQDAGGR